MVLKHVAFGVLALGGDAYAAWWSNSDEKKKEKPHGQGLVLGTSINPRHGYEDEVSVTEMDTHVIFRHVNDHSSD